MFSTFKMPKCTLGKFFRILRTVLNLYGDVKKKSQHFWIFDSYWKHTLIGVKLFNGSTETDTTKNHLQKFEMHVKRFFHLENKRNDNFNKNYIYFGWLLYNIFCVFFLLIKFLLKIHEFSFNMHKLHTLYFTKRY